MLVLSMNVVPPEMITDCLSILIAAAMGTSSVTAPSKALAAIWSLIAAAVDGDATSLVKGGRLKWMPSHASLAAIETSLKSDGRPVTAIEWRANRLDDALAKAAAGNDPLCCAVAKVFGEAEALVKHEAAVLGVVTYAANHRIVEIVMPEGRSMQQTMRDSTGVRRVRRRPFAAKAVCSTAAVGIADTSGQAPMMPTSLLDERVKGIGLLIPVAREAATGGSCQTCCHAGEERRRS